MEIIYKETKLIDRAVGDTPYGKFLVESFNPKPVPDEKDNVSVFQDGLVGIIGIITNL